ncbi:MAG TPA: hypothetical protein VM717_13020 [Chthoniobacterales bacterium]|jgi:hypothetical protein|nr:hypothetical protein [Chthoniobacterales bacterium]
MCTPQNTIAIVYDYGQTLSPSYMHDAVVFPAFGLDARKFWTRCTELVRDHATTTSRLRDDTVRAPKH